MSLPSTPYLHIYIIFFVSSVLRSLTIDESHPLNFFEFTLISFVRSFIHWYACIYILLSSKKNLDPVSKNGKVNQNSKMQERNLKV